MNDRNNQVASVQELNQSTHKESKDTYKDSTVVNQYVYGSNVTVININLRFKGRHTAKEIAAGIAEAIGADRPDYVMMNGVPFCRRV